MRIAEVSVYWRTTQAIGPRAEVAAVVVGRCCPGVLWTAALPETLGGTWGAVDGVLVGVAELRNADRLLPQHIVVSFWWLRTWLDDEGFLAQPFEQTRPARERQP
jgi:hypothetical protein